MHQIKTHAEIINNENQPKSTAKDSGFQRPLSSRSLTPLTSSGYERVKECGKVTHVVSEKIYVVTYSTLLITRTIKGLTKIFQVSRFLLSRNRIK